MINWTLEKRKVKDLKPYSENPRKMTKKQAEQLQGSITKFGLCEPIVINQDNIIIGGHQRVKTLKRMKQKEAEVYVPDRMLEPKEAEELCLKLNHIDGDFDYDILANVFDPEDLFEWGFTPEELSVDEKVLAGEVDEEENEKCPTCGKKMKKTKQ